MILLKNTTIHDPTGPHHLEQRDILIKDGLIADISKSINTDGCEVVQHEDLHTSIGWMDSSVCFGEPGFEERQTLKNGLATAANGGFTNVMVNPNNKPNPQDAAGIHFLKSSAQNAAVNIHPVGCLTIDSQGNHLAELYDMHTTGAISFYDFKKSIENPNLLKVALQYAKSFEGIIQSYPEDAQIAGKGMVSEDPSNTQLGLRTIPKFAEELRVARDLQIARYTGAAIHFPTVTTGAALDLIEKAKSDGLQISCSVSIHHLGITSDALEEYDTNFKVQPPLRDAQELEAIQAHIEKGTVDMITTDHIPLTIESKNVEFDQAEYGTTGLESAFGAILNYVSLEKAINLLSGAYPVFLKEQPKIAVGKPANLSLFTLGESYELKKEHLTSTSKNNLFLGKSMKGRALGIYNNNQLIWNG